MAKIETYINAQSPLSGSDKMIGTDSAHDNATKNFTIAELANFINGGSGFVPYTGATGSLFLGTNDLYLNDIYSNKVNTSEIDITTALYLNNDQGIAGDVLTSQGSGLAPIWTAATAGAQGIQGPVGPQGPIGPVGPAGLNWQGLWAPGNSYVVDDAVGYNGASWFCISSTSGSIAPDIDTTHWALLAAQGAQGPAGATGAQGPTGPQGPAGATGTNTLQQVLNNNHDLADGVNRQGTNAGGGTFSGNNVNAFGTNAAFNNSASGVNAFGYSAGYNNTFTSVNLFGYFATATANDQLVMPNDSGFSCRISYTNLTADRLYTLPDNSGTIALISDIPSAYKVYSAIVEFVFGSPNVQAIQVLENTTGATISFSYTFGSYYVNSSSPIFLVNKSVVIATPYIQGTTLFNVLGGRTSDTSMYFKSINTSNGAQSAAYNTPFFLEVRIYN